MSLALQSSQNLAIQLQSIFSQELPLLAHLGENWNLYRLGSGLFRVTRMFTDQQIKSLPGIEYQIAPQSSGNAIVPMNAAFVFHWVADYANIDAASSFRFWADPSGNQYLTSMTDLNAVLAAGNSTLSNAPMDDAVIKDGTGGDDPAEAVKLVTANAAAGDFTGGDPANTLTIIFDFTTIPVTSW